MQIILKIEEELLLIVNELVFHSEIIIIDGIRIIEVIRIMSGKEPTLKEIDELLSFLPRFYHDEFQPIEEWVSGDREKKRDFIFPFPRYNELVYRFFSLAAQECWVDYSYNPEQAGRMLEDLELVKRASLKEIKTMLTYCVRGERFCSGHWGIMIMEGYIRRILERLLEIKRELVAKTT